MIRDPASRATRDPERSRGTRRTVATC